MTQIASDIFKQKITSNEERKSFNDIMLENIRSGYISLINKDGKVKLSKDIYDLGLDFSQQVLFRIDESLYGIASRDGVSVTSSGKIIADYKYLLTLLSDGKFFIEEFSIEKIAPKREDENNFSYDTRKYLHGDSISSQLRTELVLSRLEYGAETSLSDLNDREKQSLANFYFLSGDKAKKHYQLIDFTKKFGVEGLKSFLACEYGMNIGDTIIELGDKLPQEIAEKLFSKYQEIIFESHRALEVIKSFNGQVDFLIEKKIKESLLKKAKDLLVFFHFRTDIVENLEDLSKELDVIKADIILFASTFKALSESGEGVDFQEVSQVRLETKKPESLSPTEKEEMVRIFLVNRETGYSEALLKEVFADFEKSINPEKASTKAAADFTILKYNNQIVSFLRLEPRGEGRVYAAAFNTRPEAKGFKIGNAMMKEVIERVAEENTVEAVVYSQKADLLNFYQKFFGFKPVGETEIAGEKFIKIEKAKKKIEKFDLVA